jgi:hypothetical protein
MNSPVGYPLATRNILRSACTAVHLLATVATTVSLSWRAP